MHVSALFINDDNSVCDMAENKGVLQDQTTLLVTQCDHTDRPGIAGYGEVVEFDAQRPRGRQCVGQ